MASILHFVSSDEDFVEYIVLCEPSAPALSEDRIHDARAILLEAAIKDGFELADEIEFEDLDFGEMPINRPLRP